jgi:hypothetical protein
MAQSFVVSDPDDGHPILINGGTDGPDSDGMEPAIPVIKSSTSDMYIAPGLARLSAQGFPQTGSYRVILFSHYHGDSFCKYGADAQLKPEFVKACKIIKYRSCYLGVNTHKQQFFCWRWIRGHGAYFVADAEEGNLLGYS